MDTYNSMPDNRDGIAPVDTMNIRRTFDHACAAGTVDENCNIVAKAARRLSCGLELLALVL